MTHGLSLVLFAMISAPVFASSSEPDWSAQAALSSPRSNPYGYDASEWAVRRKQGQQLALEYPVEVSGVLAPWRPIKQFLNEPSPSPLRHLLQTLFQTFSKIRSTDDLFAIAGLQTFPQSPQAYPFDFPVPTSSEKTRMGVTLIHRDGVEAFTLSCAACHASNLFGTKILGMTNRFPRANEFYSTGKTAAKFVSSELFSISVNASRDETALYERLRDRAQAVGVKKPEIIGLDTSLAQVALSLARRSEDEVASFDPKFERKPRKVSLATEIADSKPAVWWNLKYKTRWLSDGSVVSGNPVYTNFLWNEIGRGTDLVELESWLDRNEDRIRSLTTAVFSTEAPLYTDFFPAESISLDRARRGEIKFQALCSRCHGTYEKNWSLPEASALSAVELLKTHRVNYPEKTFVRNVGTDPGRARGMKDLEVGLNPLRISQKNSVRIETQSGYVPPPLVGIWARWPYFHNNSVSSLCEVLTPASERVKQFYMGEALDRNRDFDSECNGYPLGAKTPEFWKTADFLYDTRRKGLSNQGHDEGIFMKNGVSLITPEDRRDLVEYLKTL